MEHQSYVIGVDYGTDSVRSMVVNASSGEELAFSVFYYPVGKSRCIAMHHKINFVSIR